MAITELAAEQANSTSTRPRRERKPVELEVRTRSDGASVPRNDLPLPGLEIVGGVAVISPRGTLDCVLPIDFVRSLETAASSGPMVVDLTAAVLTNRDTAVGLAAVVAATASPGDYCFVSGRATGRQLLRTWGIARCGAVFASVQDALQARRFLNDNYGDGWAPQVGPPHHT